MKMTPQLRNRTMPQGMTTCSYLVPFRIPPGLSDQADSSPCLLFKLPPEILIQIFQHAAQPIDGVMLALSCKRMLAASKLAHLQVPDRDHHVSRGSSEPLRPKGDSCSCFLVSDLLKRFRPLDSQGRTSRAWGWCLDCNRYRPRRKQYWSDLLRKTNTEDWADVHYSSWDEGVDWYNRDIRRQCPPCAVEGYRLIAEREDNE